MNAAGPRVLVTRPVAQARPLVAALAACGLEPVVVPAIAVEPVAPGALEAEIGRIGRYDWVVVTSANGARAVLAAVARLGGSPAGPRWAAVGEPTATALREGGVARVWSPGVGRGEALGNELPLEPGSSVLLARGSLADGDLPATLRRRGAHVKEVVAYRTREGPPRSRALLVAALDGRLDGVLFASASAVRGSLALAGRAQAARLLAVPAVTIGASTTREARAAGFHVLAESATPDATALAGLAARFLGEASREATREVIP